MSRWRRPNPSLQQTAGSFALSSSHALLVRGTIPRRLLSFLFGEGGESLMEAVTIHDTRPLGSITVLAYDLADLLALAGPDALASSWSCRMVECIGPGADELHRAAYAGPIAGSRLAELAAGVSQTIDGVFEASLPDQGRPWLVLRCIDGCYFVVVTRSGPLLAEVRRRFRDVRLSAEDAAWYAEPYAAADPARLSASGTTAHTCGPGS